MSGFTKALFLSSAFSGSDIMQGFNHGFRAALKSLSLHLLLSGFTLERKKIASNV